MSRYTEKWLNKISRRYSPSCLYQLGVLLTLQHLEVHHNDLWQSSTKTVRDVFPRPDAMVINCPVLDQMRHGIYWRWWGKESAACLVGVFDMHTEAQLLQYSPLCLDYLSLGTDVAGIQRHGDLGPGRYTWLAIYRIPQEGWENWKSSSEPLTFCLCCVWGGRTHWEHLVPCAVPPRSLKPGAHKPWQPSGKRQAGR
jgi:hypothetical protein